MGRELALPRLPRTRRLRGRGERAVDRDGDRRLPGRRRACDDDVVANDVAGDELRRHRGGRDRDPAPGHAVGNRPLHRLRGGRHQPLRVRRSLLHGRLVDARHRRRHARGRHRDRDADAARGAEVDRRDAVGVCRRRLRDAACTRRRQVECDAGHRGAGGGDEADRGCGRLAGLERPAEAPLDPVGPVEARRLGGDRLEDRRDLGSDRIGVDLARSGIAHQRVDVEHHCRLPVRARRSPERPCGVGHLLAVHERDLLAGAVRQRRLGLQRVAVRGRRVPVAEVDAERAAPVRQNLVVAEPADPVPIGLVEADAVRPARVAAGGRARVVRVRRVARERAARGQQRNSQHHRSHIATGRTFTTGARLYVNRRSWPHLRHGGAVVTRSGERGARGQETVTVFLPVNARLVIAVSCPFDVRTARPRRGLSSATTAV